MARYFPDGRSKPAHFLDHAPEGLVYPSFNLNSIALNSASWVNVILPTPDPLASELPFPAYQADNYAKYLCAIHQNVSVNIGRKIAFTCPFPPSADVSEQKFMYQVNFSLSMQRDWEKAHIYFIVGVSDPADDYAVGTATAHRVAVNNFLPIKNEGTYQFNFLDIGRPAESDSVIHFGVMFSAVSENLSSPVVSQGSGFFELDIQRFIKPLDYFDSSY